tara:strand:+ start:99 stop:494 length:396 start_codon:yes stop_codon:yes gene_type:complete
MIYYHRFASTLKSPLSGLNYMQQVVNGILVVNTETIPGKIITETMGVVSGSTVRAKNVGKDIFAGLKNIVGGELTQYTELLQESRAEAVGRMVADAMSIGATAVVNVRFATSAITVGAAELFAYGTAVKYE